jgi:hypothetical protein
MAWLNPLPSPSTLLLQSGKRDSNPRPQPWQGCALPTELFPRLPHGVRPTSLTFRRPAANLWSPTRHRAARGYSGLGSGGEGDRTPDLVNAIHALSQLSYAPLAGPGVGFRQEPLSLNGYKW